MRSVVVGLDEVGRGAWAGPLVVGAVILPPTAQIDGLTDSKQLSPAARERLVPIIQSVAISWAVGAVEVPELDQLGLGSSLGLAAGRALDQLTIRPDRVLVDGKYPYRNLSITQRPIVRGDTTILAISAASVIAKVHRDRLMVELHTTDQSARPFRFDRNKGYPSLLHRTALAQIGPSLHHRRSFAPIRRLALS